jgi:FKBP-type peptidyl-prolyl cis-trans isomerase FklB
MKRFALAPACYSGAVAVGFLLAGCDSTKPVQSISSSAPAGTNVLADGKSRESYALGMYYGHNLQQQGVEMDWNMYARGFKDVQSGGAMLLTDQEMRDTLTALQKTIAAKQQQMREEQAAKHKAESDVFLAKNKTQPGVVTLPDGLQYKVITEGNGEVPGDNSTIMMNFRGMLVDGTEFDNSARLGKPVELPVGGIPLRGWSEALKLMKAGSKWQLFIPPELAYGQNGMAPRVPPNSALVMEVELLSVGRPQSQTAAVPPSSPNQPLTSDIIKVPSAEEMKQGAKIEIIKAEDVQKLQESRTNAPK